MAVGPNSELYLTYADYNPAIAPTPDEDGQHADIKLKVSRDGGVTWNETRVSHDSWDPSINPPISGSGEFIGDYQGLVADDCAAIPFENNTHLVNDPARDPDFDRRHPRSEFQEAFSWLVPNTKAFGGLRPRDCGKGGGGDGHDDDDDRDDDRRDRRADSPADQAAASAARTSAQTLSGYSGAATRAIRRGHAKMLGLLVR